MPELINKSLKIIEESRIDEIWQVGIRRNFFDYHSTVMYPPLKAMSHISEREIYSHFQNNSRDFSLYIHIPFCSGRCTFCYFHLMENPPENIVEGYLNALQKEIRIAGKKIKEKLGAINIRSIFFGGGSPTLLSVNQFKKLISAIKDEFGFPEGIEITMEIQPEIIQKNGRALLETYFKHNVNRLNIGIQSFNDYILTSANRRHTSRDGIEIFELARKTGFNNINIDLLYPLPDLTPEIWEETLNIAFDLEPESVTTYFTAIREPSVMYELSRHHPDRFPNEYLNHLFRVMAIEKSKEKGYDHRKLIDWYVKPRDVFHYQHQRNEVKKTEEIQLLSFGSGVFSYVNYFQFFNYPDIHKYCSMLNENVLPVWKGIKLSKEERLARAMVLGIKSGEISADEINRRFDADISKKYKNLLDKLEALGLIEKTDKSGDLRLSEKGILFADEVSVQFITDEMYKKLCNEDYKQDTDRRLIEIYNFMYNINGLNLLK